MLSYCGIFKFKFNVNLSHTIQKVVMKIRVQYYNNMRLQNLIVLLLYMSNKYVYHL